MMISMPPGSRLGRYQILKELGRGGMAAVFQAHDPSLDRNVAIKVLPSFHTQDPSFLDRFTQEAQAVARLNHPGILQIFDFGEDKGFTYIVTEYVPGGTLLDRLRGEPVSVDESLRLTRPLAEALDHAHTQGILHRDLKPANVLLDADSRPILADFGLAWLLEAASRFTQVQQVVGTPDYMSPEQALGGDLDHRSDLYSFGVVLYEMLLGRPPFHTETPTATLMAHVHTPVPLPSSLDPDFNPRIEAVLLRALAKDPKDRYSSATRLVDSLAEAAGQAPAAGTEAVTQVTAAIAAPPGARERAAPAPPPPPRRRRWLLAGAGVGVVGVAIVAVAAVLLFSGDGEPDGARVAVAADTTPAATPSPTTPPGTSATELTPDTPTPPTPTETPTPPTPTETPTPAPPTATPTPAPPTATPTPAVSLAEALESLEEVRTRVESGVPFLRHLIPKEEIQVKYRTRAQLAELIDAYLSRQQLRDQVFNAQALYRTLGILSADDDLEQISRSIVEQQVSALFDDDGEVLYVLSDSPSFGGEEELAYAMAYMGGLQQQLFDIARMRRRASESGSLDQFRAVTAFIEADVYQIREGYTMTLLSKERVAELNKPLADNPLKAAPNVVRRAALFPQQAGFDFIASMFQSSGSWDGVDAVYAKPPVSTEQIIHPEKYLDSEQPVIPELPELEDGMGKGWNLLSENTLGEFLLRTYLEEHLEQAQAGSAAAGWGGDRYALLAGPEGERVLALLINWDTSEDSDEFFEAYAVFAENKTEGNADAVTDDPSRRWWITQDQTLLLTRSNSSTLLVIGKTRALVQRVLSVFSGS
jgi:serine/threonine-protein kinase